MPLVLSLYGIIYAWYFYCGNPSNDVRAARAAAPWYTHKKEPSLLDILAVVNPQDLRPLGAVIPQPPTGRPAAVGDLRSAWPKVARTGGHCVYVKRFGEWCG